LTRLSTPNPCVVFNDAGERSRMLLTTLGGEVVNPGEKGPEAGGEAKVAGRGSGERKTLPG
jgi:hypothetical protein